MSKKVKRSISIIISAFLVFTLFLTGCQKPEEKTDTATTGATTATKEATTTAAAQQLEPYEITWYFIGNGQQKDTELVEAEANKYLKDKINATIKLTCFDWGSYTQKIQLMLSAGEPLDICFTCDWANDFRGGVKKGYFLPLNDLMDKYAPKLKALLGEDFLRASAIDGVNYAIPANKEKARCKGILFRKDLVDKYGFDLSKIKTMEDCEPLYQTIKEKEPGVYAVAAGNGSDGIMQLNEWDDVLGGAPGCAFYIDNRDTTVYIKSRTPEYKKLLQTVRKYYLAGYIRKDAASINDINPDLKAGKIFSVGLQLKPGKDTEISNATGYKWVQVPLTPIIMTNAECTGSMQAISRTSKNPERAMMFLELFNTDKYLNNLINFGIENKHYIKISENVIDYAPETNGGKDSGYNPALSWMFGNVLLNYTFPNQDPDIGKKYEEFNSKALVMNSLGFVFDNTNVKTECAAVANAGSEFSALQVGAIDPEVYLPKLIEKERAAGIDKIRDEVQRQYDEWLRKKK